MTNEQTDDRERYIDKVRKILAKAERAGTQEEAEVFFAKAAELITKWRIEDIELDQAGNTDDLETRKVQLGTYTPTADVMAMKRVFKPLGVEVAYINYGGKGRPPFAVLIGWTRDIDKAQLLWASVEIQMVTVMKRTEPAGFDRNFIREWRQSFKLGFTKAVGHRMAMQVAVAKDAAEATTPGVGLVLVSKDQQLQKFIEDGTRPGRHGRVNVNTGAHLAGERAGSQADLGGTRLGASKKEVGA